MKEIFKNNRYTNYDVIVIGAGHAGCEAALASARNSSHTLLININMDSIAIMPFSNKIGGPGKGELLMEINVLGSEITRNADRTFLNMKMIVDKNNPCEKALSAVVDKRKYFINMKNVLDNQEGLDTRQGLVVEISGNKNNYYVRTSDGISYKCKSVVVSTGTFMRASIFWGEYKIEAGRQGEINSRRLSEYLCKMGFKFARTKIYSTPQIDGKTIDFSKMKSQTFDEIPAMFSKSEKFDKREQSSNYLTYADNECMEYFLKKSGNKASCEMELIEEFKSKTLEGRNLEVLIQPEGRKTSEYNIYTMPMAFFENEQLEIIQRIRGLEGAKITRPGYGIEYDYITPLQISKTMESIIYKGMFFAGMINGSRGYEESASQGIIAGINASRSAKNMECINLNNDDGYLGLLLNEVAAKNRQVYYGIRDLKKEYGIKYSYDKADLRMLKVLKLLDKKGEIEKIEEKYRKVIDC